MRSYARAVALITMIIAGDVALPEERGLVPLVPWKVLQPGDVVDAPLVLFWIPSSPEAMRRSTMLTSEHLTSFSSRCVAMRVVRFDDGARLARLHVEEELPMAVLADKDGNVLGSVKQMNGKLSVLAVEALVRNVLDERESAAEKLLDEARRRAEDDDLDAALELYEVVVASRCVCPRQAKTAQKAMRKLARR